MTLHAITRVLVFSMVLLSPFLAHSRETDRAMRRPSGDKRTALVIGNAAYRNGSPLKNAVNDAEDISAVLARKGFEVTVAKDATHRQMESSIRKFGRSLQQGGVGLFFYAGHGIQVNGINYLIPVDADIQEQDEVPFKAVNANMILAKMESAGNALNMVILDACRVNPFGTRFRGSSQGLAQMDAPSGSLVVFSTSPGSVAEDGKGRNGTFTKHLLAKMDLPGLEIREMLSQVRAEVERESVNKQTPWELSSLKGKFYFTVSISPEGPEDEVPSDIYDPETMAWKLIENSSNAQDLKDFIAVFPEGKLASLARFKLKVLERKHEESSTVNIASVRNEDNPQSLFEKARSHLESKSYKEAQELFLTAAQKDHAPSQNELGFMYKHGLGMKRSYSKAIGWFRKAADNGYAPSQNNMGVMYFKGEGVRKDPKEAAEWFRTAANQGDAEGQFYLATMYRYGYGVQKDTKEAAAWFKKAADQGHKEAGAALKQLGK